MPYGTIYMLPTPIGDRPVYDVLPEYNRAVMARLDYFIVENERTARRFLSRAGIGQADRRPADSRVERAHDAGTGSGIAGSRTRRRRCGRTVGGGSPGVADREPT